MNYKLVSVEPTAEMVRAMNGSGLIGDLLRAAIAAAPDPVMPELPEPFVAWDSRLWTPVKSTPRDYTGPLFTTTQLHAYAQQYAAAMNGELQARIAELEAELEAAQRHDVRGYV